MKRTKKPWSIIMLALAMCFLLYFAGVLSGLYANRLTEERTQTTLSIFKQETQEDLEDLKSGTESQIGTLTNYIRYLEKNMNIVQTQQAFLATVPEEDRCRFSSIILKDMTGQLQYYRDRLPYRLEEYERDNRPSDEYRQLKEEYNALSIRTWIFARSLAKNCNTDLVQGLYFYTPECGECVEQGKQLDLFTSQLSGRDVMLFTIDLTEPAASFLARFYNITTVPAVVVNDVVSEGLVPAGRLLEAVS